MIIQETPTLNAQFDKARNDSDMLSLIKSFGGTFTRVGETLNPDAFGAATYTDALGKVNKVKSGYPRPNFVDGVNQGLLIEEERTNLLTYSNDTTDASWVKSQVTVSNQTINNPTPDTTIGRLLSDTETSTEHRVRKSLSLSVSTAYTASAIVKDIDVRYFYIRDLTNNYWIVFDTTDVDLVASNAGITGSITDIGGGFYKIQATFTTPSPITNNLIDFGITSSSSNFQSVVSSGSGGYLGAFQLEEGSFGTSYIPTTSATVTRGADNASITGTAFSDFYNQNEGSFVVDYLLIEANLAGQSVVLINDGTNNNRLLISANVTSGNYGAFIEADDIIYLIETLALSEKEIIYKLGLSYKENDVFLVDQDGTNKSDVSVVLPLVNELIIGGNISPDVRKLNGTIKRIIYYPKALTDAELQLLTRI